MDENATLSFERSVYESEPAVLSVGKLTYLLSHHVHMCKAGSICSCDRCDPDLATVAALNTDSCTELIALLGILRTVFQSWLLCNSNLGVA